MSWHRCLLAVVAVSVSLSGARNASAFCRATTCDPSQAGGCPANKEGCETTGAPLYWASNCVTVSVQGDAAPSQNIDYATAEGSIKRAFAAWTNADCGGSPPSITIDVQGPVQCDKSEYNSAAGNANIVLFREGEWPYPGGQDALGVTFVNFDPESGEIWDVDVEVNAVTETLSIDPSADEVDLDSLLTHEAGHLLGLGHTQDRAATMFPGYTRGSTGLRTLGYDDVSGLCAIYPASRQVTSTSCVPRHGFSELCGADQPPAPPSNTKDSATAGGCSLSPQAGGSASAFFAALSLGFAAFLGRRRRHY
ncbi:MAG: matrixin family metalloprotease [Pseudomonadota bacterium]